MDVDVTEVNTIGTHPDPRIQKARNEGRCFFCNQQGHIKRNCPKKETPQTTENKKAFNYKAFGDHIQSLNLEEREEAVGEILSKMDFQ